MTCLVHSSGTTHLLTYLSGKLRVRSFVLFLSTCVQDYKCSSLTIILTSVKEKWKKGVIKWSFYKGIKKKKEGEIKLYRLSRNIKFYSNFANNTLTTKWFFFSRGIVKNGFGNNLKNHLFYSTTDSMTSNRR